MIRGANDTWFTIEEVAEMIGRAPKTILNWASEGKIQFASLCGVNLVSMRLLETLITGTTRLGWNPERLALEMMGRITRDGDREDPERRKRRGVSTRRPLVPVQAQPQDQGEVETRACDP